ncbi:MAG: hypothetical protein ABI693_01595 [Bryobacteraceae bacterium]
MLTLLLAQWLWPQATYRGRIGVEIEDADEGSRSRAFADLGRVFRPWATISGTGTVPLDANGWPLTDAVTVMFDVRPIPAWAPPIDDPAQFQPDWSGTYSLSFEGQASVSTPQSTANILGLTWNAATNTTTGQVIVPPGSGLLSLQFDNTKRTVNAPTNTGIASLKLIRPGYPAAGGQVYTHEFLDSLAPFSAIRFMGFTDANNADQSPYPAVLNWSDRRLITDATQQPTGSKTGFAWEYAILLANQSGKDMWINIPVSATEDYIRQLALLLKARLNPGLKVYIEHSNEVWNQTFSQYFWNQNAAAAEGLPSNLIRHVKRLGTISNIFKDVYGAAAINRQIRVIFSWWTIQPAEYDTGLLWLRDNMGEPSTLLYGISQTHYYNDQNAPSTATPDTVLSAMQSDSDNGANFTRQLAAIASTYNLKLTVYEGGPDNGGGNTTNIGNRILSNRLPGMKDLVVHDARDNWFALGGDLYMYFTLSGAVSRYGSWGAVEDIANLDTPKYNGLLELIGPPAQQATITSIGNSANGTPEVAPGTFFSIYGADFTSLTAQWGEAIIDGVTLPTALSGVRVRINGRDAYVFYASPTQINAVGPPDDTIGNVLVEVITANGRASKTVPMASVSPAFYGYPLNNANFAWAVSATEPGPVYIAVAGAFAPEYQSRPARPGDILSFFVNGLGGLSSDYPTGRVLPAPYAIDPSVITVNIDGIPATVLYAGVTYPGEYQVNLTVPSGTRSGTVPIAIIKNGRTGTSSVIIETK